MSDRRWLIQDRMGSVIGAANASGVSLATYAYDEYGRANAWSSPARQRYTGQMMLPEAQLYHYRARAYSPALGRFLQSDPILHAGGMNLHAYVGNDPVNATDPSGEILFFLVGAAIGAGTDFALQMIANDGDLSQVDLGSIGVSAALGLVGGYAGFLGKAAVTGRFAISGVGAATSLPTSARAALGANALLMGGVVGCAQAVRRGHADCGRSAVQGAATSLFGGAAFDRVMDFLRGRGGSFIASWTYGPNDWEALERNGDHGFTLWAPNRSRRQWGDNRLMYGTFRTEGFGYQFLRYFTMSNWERMSAYIDPEIAADRIRRESIP